MTNRVRSLRKIVMLGTLAVTGALVVLSIIGAFAGVEHAIELFNSIPLVIFWSVLAGLLVLGFASYKRLLRSPGALATHLGVLLVLLGAMYGSQRGHEIVARISGKDRLPAGYMRIHEGQSSNIIISAEGHPLATLPFHIRLEDFWIERYEAPAQWGLGVEVPAVAGVGPHELLEIHWTEGQEMEIPRIAATLEVLKYLPRARPDYESGAEPRLEVVTTEGTQFSVAAEVGQTLALNNPGHVLRIVEVFSHLQVRGGKAVDVPGKSSNPALAVEVKSSGGDIERRYVFPRGMRSSHHQGSDSLELSYAIPMVSSAVADKDSGLPAMEVRVRNDQGGEIRRWLIPTDAEHPVVLPLPPVRVATARAQDSDGLVRGVSLIMGPRSGGISDYKSRLTVLDEHGEPAAERVIEVNDPLHVGGYHFYQHSYDSRHGRFTVLGVRSDAGLLPVYIGFALLCLGTVWLSWLRPIWARRKKGTNHGA
jgi:hypothetical protein